MSTKKDKFSLKDKFYMEIALKLANSRQGLTGSNPSVGCVIVKNDKIISIGQTSFNGRPHAEWIDGLVQLVSSKYDKDLWTANHWREVLHCFRVDLFRSAQGICGAAKEGRKASTLGGGGGHCAAIG